MTSARRKHKVATLRKVKRTSASEKAKDTSYLKAGGSFLLTLINTHFTHFFIRTRSRLTPDRVSDVTTEHRC